MHLDLRLGQLVLPFHHNTEYWFGMHSEILTAFCYNYHVVL